MLNDQANIIVEEIISLKLENWNENGVCLQCVWILEVEVMLDCTILVLNDKIHRGENFIVVAIENWNLGLFVLCMNFGDWGFNLPLLLYYTTLEQQSSCRCRKENFIHNERRKKTKIGGCLHFVWNFGNCPKI